MKSLLLGLLILSGCAGREALIEHKECGLPCYNGPSGTLDVGQCSSGVYVCRGDQMTCEHQVLPEAEMCDAVDNDCDGYVDDHAEDIRLFYKDYDGDGYGASITKLSCDLPDGFTDNDTDCNDTSEAIHPGAQEVCDGVDNDCDGERDEPEDLPLEFCYTGNPDDLMHSDVACHAGVVQCSRGEPFCANEQLPSTEICNALDDDCDGRINEDKPAAAAYDFVFVLDESGSMQPIIDNVISAAQQFAQIYNTDEYRFALVLAPASGNDLKHPRDQVILYRNFLNASSFSLIMNTEEDGLSGFEPLYDAIYEVCEPSNPFGLNWRSDSLKAVIFFGDEPGTGQTLLMLDETMVANECRDAGVIAHGFVEYGSEFDEIATLTGGKIHGIRGSSTEMVQDLIKVVGSVCQ